MSSKCYKYWSIEKHEIQFHMSCEIWLIKVLRESVEKATLLRLLKVVNTLTFFSSLVASSWKISSNQISLPESIENILRIRVLFCNLILSSSQSAEAFSTFESTKLFSVSTVGSFSFFDILIFAHVKAESEFSKTTTFFIGIWNTTYV